MTNNDFRTNFQPGSDFPAECDLLDEALEETFPASDPPAVVLPGHRTKPGDLERGAEAAALNGTGGAFVDTAPRATATALPSSAASALAEELNRLLADSFALYLKTKNFHWHVSGAHFRDYHLLFDEQASQILAATDAIAERVRKIGGTTLRSIGHVARLQRISDNDADFVPPKSMLRELIDDNMAYAGALRRVHTICEAHGDVATAGLVETWLDEAETRVWFLREASRAGHGGE